MDVARIGVIGLGRFAETHLRVWSQLPRVELVAVCSRSAERARAIAEKYGAAHCYTDLERMLADPDVVAVDVCTELARHGEVALAALRHGKHVLCEVLLTDSIETNDALIELAEKNRRSFMVGFIERFDVRRAVAKQKVASGDLGQLVSLHGRRNVWRGHLDSPRDKPYPLILQPGIHTIDQLLWLNSGDPVREVYARTRSLVDPRKPDTWWAMLTFASGLIGVVEQSYFVPDRRLYWSDVRLEVVGTRGTIHLAEPNDGFWIWQQDAVESPDLYLDPEAHGRLVGALEHQLDYFAACVARGQAPRIGTLAEARDALRVGLAIVQSADQQMPIKL